MARPASPPAPPELFVDRSLGRHIFPGALGALGALGLVVHTMGDVYPGGEDELVSDERWIADVDAAGWVALTKDERITPDPSEQAALARSHLRVFAIGNQHLTSPQMAERYTTNIHRILQRARKPGPFVDIVQADSVKRRWPTDAHHRRPQP